jgi:hypothetical protein
MGTPYQGHWYETPNNLSERFSHRLRHLTVRYGMTILLSGMPDVPGPSPSPPPPFKDDCSQLFAELFSQSRRKIRPLREKIWSPSNFPFLKEFGPKENTILVCVSRKITIFLGHFARIREDSRRETIVLKSSTLFVQSRPKFGRKIVRPLHFLFGHFWLVRPNNRPVGNTA